jgi:uncharacterized membrane protein YbhN (UPF0104 family)
LAGQPLKRHVVFAIKLALSAAALAAIATRINTDRILLQLANSNFAYFLAALAAALITVPLVGARWSMISARLGFLIAHFDATRATFAGLFVGQVLPGAVGGDVVRGLLVWEPGAPKLPLVASLIFDRFLALLAIVIIILLTLPALLPALGIGISASVGVWLCLLGLLGLVASALALRALAPWIRRKLGPRYPICGIPLFTILAGLGVSCVVHGLTILSAYYLSRSFGLDVDPMVWILIVPVTILGAAIPISINGWGIREGLMAFLGASFGLPETDAVLISVCMGLVAMTASIPGFWFWFSQSSAERAQSSEELEMPRP